MTDPKAELPGGFEQAHHLLCQCVGAFIPVAKERLSKWSNGRHWVSVRGDMHRLPSATRGWNYGPPSIENRILSRDQPEDLTLPEFKAFVAYLGEWEPMRRLVIPDDQQSNVDWIEFTAAQLTRHVLDAELHGGSSDMARSAREFLLGAVNESLQYEVLAPLPFLLVQDADDLNPGILETLDNETIGAITPEEFVPSMSDQIVAMTARFALPLGTVEIPNYGMHRRERRLSDELPRLVSEMEPIIAAIAIVADCDYGIAHFVFKPLGWSSYPRRVGSPSYRSELVDNYPYSWRNYRWLGDPIVVPADDFALALVVADRIRASKRLALASRRLNAGSLRRVPEDSILDYCIGLEALLAGPSKTELTHQLALRTAALARELPLSEVGWGFGEPYELSRVVKHIYKYRSAVVHGSSNARKFAKLPSQGTDTVQAAREILRNVILALAARPELDDPVTIDRTLLLAAQAKPEAQAADDPDE